MKAEVYSRRITDTPRSAPLAPGNCGHEDEEDRIKRVNSEPTCLNDAISNPEVVDKGGEGNPAIQINKTYAFVLHSDGTPLMPMLVGKAKNMIRHNKAVVVKCKPLVIKLSYDTGKRVDDLTMGIDSGAIYIGYSIISKESLKEYICGTLEQEHVGKNANPVKQRMDDRRAYRKYRRSKLWHRERRFLNRKRKIGEFAVSINRKYETHLHLIDKLKKFIPISNISIEVAKFDLSKMEDCKDGRKISELDKFLNYHNIKKYLMCRERGRCQLCGETFEGRAAHIHHIIPRSKGGTNRPANLALLHKECHIKLHNEHLEGSLKKAKSYKIQSFMSIINKKFNEDVPHLQTTYGYITAANRQIYNIGKSHCNDAFVIAGGNNLYSRSMQQNLKQRRRNNRCLQWNNIKRKGSGGRRIRKSRNIYHSGDSIFVNGEWIECKGTSGGKVVTRFALSSKGTKYPILVVPSKVKRVFFNNGLYFV